MPPAAYEKERFLTMYQLEPASVQSVVEAYLDALDVSGLGSRFYGIYLYGSIPLGGFDEQTSDIDIIALTLAELAPTELARLQAIHERLAQEPAFGGLGRRLDVMYIPLRDLGKRNSEVASYPYMADGEFHRSGHFDLNGVAWWLVKYHGWALRGPEPRELHLSTSWEDVLVDMDYNLNTYWARQYAGLQARKDEDTVPDEYAVLFTVSTLCRILSTIEDREIPTKPQALLVWRDRLPEQFHRSVDEALRISRHSNEPSLYTSPAALRADGLAFMQYVIERGNKSLRAQTLAANHAPDLPGSGQI